MQTQTNIHTTANRNRGLPSKPCPESSSIPECAKDFSFLDGLRQSLTPHSVLPPPQPGETDGGGGGSDWLSRVIKTSKAPAPEGVVRGEAGVGRKDDAHQGEGGEMPYFDLACEGHSGLAILHLLAQLKGASDPTGAPKEAGKEADSTRLTDADDVVRDFVFVVHLVCCAGWEYAVCTVTGASVLTNVHELFVNTDCIIHSNTHTYTHIHAYIHTYIIYVFVYANEYIYIYIYIYMAHALAQRRILGSRGYVSASDSRQNKTKVC
jgi:hypothetical protein